MIDWQRLAAGTALAMLAGWAPAQAGGFQRGTADTDVLYDKGTMTTRLGFTYVDPQRGFDSVNGVRGDYGTYTGTYRIPSAAVKFGNDTGACVGNFVEAFAAEGDYSNLPGGAQPAPFPGGSRVRDLEFQSNEVSATCRLSYAQDGMRFSLLGGLFMEDFTFEGTSLANRNLGTSLPASLQAALGSLGAQLLVPVALNAQTEADYKTGYRVGAAFEMPEIALRAQVLYRSEVEHDDITGTGSLSATSDAFVRLANGAQVSVPTAAALLSRSGITVPTALINALPKGGSVLAEGLPAFQNTATSPQSLYINAQTGIAEGTLLLGSFRWTDWSTNRAVITTVAGNSSVSPYYWDDGYSASIGLGKAFNEYVSGSVSIGYDSGVSTGAETTYTDLYTLSGGLSLKNNDWAELRIGGLIGYWTDGAQSVSNGAIYNATVGNDFVYAANASIKLNF
ncbi:long-chain fatty acid transporter [Aureimonas pseudogalii]|uniref:Long-chain fatty acid transport protein n=1 Tax=Aureimonas pseudogalii TaxID=1744844 RepID=A0A7W6MKM9_9HYPH|nr:long-chain fatty acid transporter [Aureimonas pseudogalii]MBB3999118.1 long-chain fatty acid transport protein [Aureimonas pseudogalii]